jgi:hypothetical protein
LSRTVALLSLLGLASVVAACGAHSANPPTKEAYQRELRPAGAELSRVLRTLPSLAAASIKYPPKPTAARTAAAALVKARAQLRDAAGRIADAAPPAAVSREHAALGRAVRRLDGELAPLIAKLKQGYLVVAGRLRSLPGARDVDRALAALRSKGYRIGAG